MELDKQLIDFYRTMYSYNSSDIPLNQWTNVTVSQTYANSTSKYTFAIEIDGTEVHSLENTRAQQFFGVKEYWSNPWADAALANRVVNLWAGPAQLKSRAATARPGPQKSSAVTARPGPAQLKSRAGHTQFYFYKYF